MPLTDSSGSHTHRTLAQARDDVHTIPTTTFYARGYAEDIAKVALEALQDRHRAAIALLGVTFEGYRLARTSLDRWVAVEFLTYDPDATSFRVPRFSSMAQEPPVEPADPHSAVATYVQETCVGDLRVEIQSLHELRDILASYELHQQQLSKQQQQLAQQEYARQVYEQWRRDGLESQDPRLHSIMSRPWRLGRDVS